jgi:Uma2 family endonuclease
MSMGLRDNDWTVDRVYALPDDGNRYEVIDGERFVTPAPSILHQLVVARLVAALQPYVDVISQLLLCAPADVAFSERRLVQPDVLVMPKIEGRAPERFTDVGRLTLAVEVLSPSNRYADHIAKRDLYQCENVPEYWIVDAHARTFDRWRPTSASAETVQDTLRWQPDPQFAAFTMDLRQFFHRVYDES